MKRYQHLLIAFFAVLFCFFYRNVNGQNLLESRLASYYTYIYKINDREAKAIYKKSIYEVDTSFFHTLVDSFVTDSLYSGNLPQGHYLKTYAEKNRQKFSITTVQDFDVFILNNNTDLVVQVFDPKGNAIEDADLRIRWKKLRFDPTRQAYIDKKSNQKGLLKVTYNGFTTFYHLERDYNNSVPKRVVRKVVYSTPLKYVWRPVNFIIHLPIDGVRSIKQGWPVGAINRSKIFFEKSYLKVACIFDDYQCKKFDERFFGNSHKGYFVFNKPKYLPGDTVKFKAFVVNKKGKPIDGVVNAVLSGWGTRINLAQLKPYTAGGYNYEFVLHDSMQLKLDRSYSVELELHGDRTYIKGNFNYEDYELSKVNLELWTDTEQQFRNRDLKLFVRGTDENDLNLMDGRLEIMVTPQAILKYFDPQLFVPDTLLFLEKKLEPTGNTEIIIPDSIFPRVNINYNVSVRLLTADNEVISESKRLRFFHRSEDFDIELFTDSLRFSLRENGLVTDKMVKIFGVDNFGKKNLVYLGQSPCTLKMSPYYLHYSAETDNLTKDFDLSNEPSLLGCFSDRSADSLIILVENPRKIPFGYSIYKKNKLVSTGYGETLDFHKRGTSSQNYFISLRYLWGGEIIEEDYRIPYYDKQLKIAVQQPQLVYPGQQSPVDILVTDAKGKPVEGVDLTAYSLTSKFDYIAPTVPYLGKQRKNKTVINNFQFEEEHAENFQGLPLDYEAWKQLSGLDSIEYYKFIYPGQDMYRFEYSTEDKLTQFAPFVVNDGAFEPVHVIYVDTKPVYFSWSTNTQPYSFRVKSGYHQVKLRTNSRQITIDSLYCPEGKKLIFSLNTDTRIKNVSIEKAEPALSGFEKQILYNYIFPYSYSFGDQLAYIEQGENIQLLKPQYLVWDKAYLAGPVAGNWTFNLMDGFSTSFKHEPFFTYEFSPQLLKMRSLELGEYPDKLGWFPLKTSLEDVALTRKSLKRQWQDILNTKRYNRIRNVYPDASLSGEGRLLIKLNKKQILIQNTPLDMLVFQYENPDFIRIYSGKTTLIHGLQQGYYKLIFIYPEGRYHIQDSIFIQPDGLNYFEADQPEILKKDAFSDQVDEIIKENLFKHGYYYPDKKELEKIQDLHREEFKFTGIGDLIEGYVFDEESGEPMIGVTVVVKGTSYGTITDVNGHYAINVPTDKDELVFSYTGFQSQNVRVDQSGLVNLGMAEGAVLLDEVVVSAYALSMIKQDMSVAGSIVESQNLLGGIPAIEGRMFNSLAGKVAGITVVSGNGQPGAGIEISIRGAQTLKFDKQPLYIIDGAVFTGDITAIDPALIEKMEVIRGAEAIAIYGSRAANGVVLIQSKNGTIRTTMSLENKGAHYDDTFLESVSKASAIRNNFSDYAFWQPRLVTDIEGKANFTVTFPDDVTSWDTHYLAMNGKRQSGQTSEQIKSYKPLMAQLAVPRFLVQGDTTYAIGKTLNYTSDSVEIITRFEVNDQSLSTESQFVLNASIDTLLLVGRPDTLSIKYFLEKPDGYFDGEQRQIPVFPAGLEKTEGKFYVLDKDTTVKLEFDPALGQVSLTATTNVLHVMENEIHYLIEYKYGCNEQLASKLKALLAWKSITHDQGKMFDQEKEIVKIIGLLEKNQNENNLWGWWKDSKDNKWISLHVLEALTEATRQGYRVGVNKNQITEHLVWELETNTNFYDRVRILKILNVLKAAIAPDIYIADLEKLPHLRLNGLLQILHLKQLYHLEYNLDTLDQYQQNTLLGNVYFGEQNATSSLLVNELQNTLLAYKILKADSVSHDEILGKMRNYFLEKRSRGRWGNTYESAKIIETILPDFLGTKKALVPPALTIDGAVKKQVKTFPFSMTVDPGQQIEITKSGNFPVYFSSAQSYWESTPTEKKGDFVIDTKFDTDTPGVLSAGNPAKLVVNLEVKKDASFVMINVPIPAGCSYADKSHKTWMESHREHFKNETAIFCEDLPRGNYIFEIDLMPRYSGIYTLNPAKVELMYFPVFNGNNELRKLKVINK